ncbi:MAG: hypothetical protein RIC55_12045 [Pirellulaceae bacterium]
MNELVETLGWFGALAGILASVVVGLVVSAFCLILAGLLLRMGRIPFRRALKASLLANGFGLTLSFTASFNHSFALGALRGIAGGSRVRLPDTLAGFSPTYFLLLSVVGLLAAAAIYSRIVPSPAVQERMPYVDALALAAVHQTVTFAVLGSLLALVWYVVSFLLPMMGPPGTSPWT